MSPYPKGYLRARDAPPPSDPITWTVALSTAHAKSSPGRQLLVAKFLKLAFASTAKTGLAYAPDSQR